LLIRNVGQWIRERIRRLPEGSIVFESRNTEKSFSARLELKEGIESEMHKEKNSEQDKKNCRKPRNARLPCKAIYIKDGARCRIFIIGRSGIIGTK
jgi:hypothetical protein